MFDWLRGLPRLLRGLLVLMTIVVVCGGGWAPLKAEAMNPSADKPEAEWLVMVYQDGDDPVLEQDVVMDFNEAERVGSTDQVHIVSQLDRYQGGYKGMGDWSGAKRFYVTKDDDMNEIHSQEVTDLGEVDMSKGQTLVDFITWAASTYPAKKHALIMSDHGAGWPGGFTDADTQGEAPSPDSASLEESFGVRMMWLKDLDQALEEARNTAGIDKFELIGLDACLMAQIEVFDTLSAHARYAAASEETEPSLGWAYASFLGALVADPAAMDGALLGQAIVNSYIDQDQMIADDTLRRELVAREYDFKGDTTPQEVAEVKGRNVTLSAVKLAAMPELTAAVDKLAVSLSKIDPNIVGEARAYAQSYEHIFGQKVPSSYIDLGNFTTWVVQTSGSEEVTAAGEELLSSLNQAVIVERHGPERPGSTGMAIYFPIKRLFERNDNFSYAAIADRFAKECTWSDFLKAFNTGQPFVTSAGESVSAPKAEAEPIQVAPLTLSATTTSTDNPVNIKTKITGDRLGFIYTFVGRLLPEEEALVIEDMDYLGADQSKEIAGVAYPDWPAEGVEVDFDWKPAAYAINDGTNSVRALMYPEDYGINGQSPAYSVSGIYIAADDSEARFALLVFRDGELNEIWGFTGMTDTGPMSEIGPEQGDQFTVLEQGINLKEQATSEDWSREGGTLTFGEQNFVSEEIPAPSGEYVVGFIAEDLDGNIYDQYETVTVENGEAPAKTQ